MNTVEKLAYRTKMAEAFIRGHFTDEDGDLRGSVDMYEADAVFQHGMQEAEDLEQAIGQVEAYEKVVSSLDIIVDKTSDLVKVCDNEHHVEEYSRYIRLILEIRNTVVHFAKESHAKIDNVKKGLYDSASY